MSLIQYFKSNGKNGFGYGSTAERVTEEISLKGKNILLTGCNSGLGKETLRVLSLRGARIIGTARTLEKAASAINEVGSKTDFPLACDLTDPKSIKVCVDTIKKGGKKLDAIICNAGIMALPKLEQAFGYELQFFTNHIGHFILVTGLLSELSPSARVVMLSSSAHGMAPAEGIEFDNLDGKKNYRPWRAYGQSKFANLLFAKELARQFEGTKKTANAVHPGVIHTNLGRHMNIVGQFGFRLGSSLFMKSIAQGAATQCYAAVHPEMNSISGAYLADCNIAKSRPDADNVELAKKLWVTSEKIVAGLKSIK